MYLGNGSFADVALEQVDHEVITTFTMSHKSIAVELDILLVKLHNVQVDGGHVGVQAQKVVIKVVCGQASINDGLLHEELEKDWTSFSTMPHIDIRFHDDLEMCIFCDGVENTLEHLHRVLTMAILLLNVSFDMNLNVLESQLTIVCDQVAIGSVGIRDHQYVASTSMPSSCCMSNWLKTLTVLDIPSNSSGSGSVVAYQSLRP